MVGNANSGKSTLVGILVNSKYITSMDLGKKYPEEYDEKLILQDLDDGNGSARSTVMRFRHEIETGKTSSVTYNHFSCQKNIVTLVDLAGQEKYLKTTIRGVSSSYPDYGIVLVEKAITKMTKEHIMLLAVLKIPFCVLFTKSDIYKDQIEANMATVTRYLHANRMKHILVKSCDDMIYQNLASPFMVPYIVMSNKTGEGFDKLMQLFNCIEKRKSKMIPTAFVIDSIYNVDGYGLIVAGISGISIAKNDEVFVGNFSCVKGGFIKTKVKTMHDDYRNFIDVLPVGSRGCLCIKLPSGLKKRLYPGMIVVKKINDVITNFNAQIRIFGSGSCTIKPGYCAYINMGCISCSIKIVKLSKRGKEVNYARCGDVLDAELMFQKNAYYVVPDTLFVFREGRTIGFGKVC